MSEWIKADTNRSKQETFVCPHCQEKCYQAYKKQKNGQCTYRFCPNCGREIRKESEDNGSNSAM